jgi:hypothetical protein
MSYTLAMPTLLFAHIESSRISNSGTNQSPFSQFRPERIKRRAIAFLKAEAGQEKILTMFMPFRESRMMIFLMLMVLVASFMLLGGVIVFSERLIRPAPTPLTERLRATE